MPKGRRFVIVFVVDGLRPDAITAEGTPTLFRLRAEGVDFTNSHSVFPTVTRVNAAALGDGDASGLERHPGQPDVRGRRRSAPGAGHRQSPEAARARPGHGRTTRAHPRRSASASTRAGSRLAARQLGFDGQRVPDQSTGAARDRRARQRRLRAGQDWWRGPAERERGDPRQVRTGAGAGRVRPLRRGGHVDAAGAARVRAAGARARRRDQLADRAGPQPAPPRRGLAVLARGPRATTTARSRACWRRSTTSG